MRNRAFKFALQLAGFTIVSLLFFVWYLGYRQNNPLPKYSDKDQIALQSLPAKINNNGLDGSDKYRTVSSEDFSGPTYMAPPKNVVKKSARYAGNTAGEAIPVAGRAKATTVRKTSAKALRNWKGVHRDNAFAKSAYERFGSLVSELSEEHGLYPEVFLARIIAYSYDFVHNPMSDPFDNNFTAMKAPNGSTRARFKNAFESLKAYAVVNAGEITRLSAEGAIAKHERAWTMSKIINAHGYIKALGNGVAKMASYEGRIGTANKVSNKKLYEREVVGEALKMTAKVDDGVRNKKAQKAGYSNWEEYIDDMPEEDKTKAERKTAQVVSAVSKKKALNLKRRVSAKKKKQRDS